MTHPDRVTLRRYVLGQLLPDDAESLEAAYFADGDLVAALDDAADDLAAEYLEGTLEAATRAAFVTTLERPAVAARLAVVQGLRARAAAAPDGTAAVAGRRPTWLSGLAAAAAIVLLVGAWWLLTPDRPTTDDQAAQAPIGAETQTVAPPPDARSFVALTLSATATRSAGGTPTVDVPPGIDDVVLSVTAPPAAPGDLLAEVRAVDTDRTWRSAVTAAGSQVATGQTTVVVPARELPTGDYILSLRRGDGTPFRAAFRVIHR